MHILRIHNYYQQPGGEDQSFAAEVNLLKDYGHQVTTYTMHNDQAASLGNWRLAKKTIWNDESYRALRSVIQQNRPQVVHFENTFPLISPSAYYAVQHEGTPVVQSLRNYRMFCANSLFFRQGYACEDCCGKILPWPGVVHACYRNSRLATAVVAGMLTTHRTIRTWQEQVDAYIALTEFGRQKFIQGGLPPHKMFVKPNFVYPDPKPGTGKGNYFLFVGRLSIEKGIDVLLNACKKLRWDLPVKIVGDGPLASEVIKVLPQCSGLEWLGRQSVNTILQLMKDASALIFPSLWYEGLPRVIVEAYAVGLPVIASNLGNMTSLIDHHRTGCHFRPGDVDDLITQIEQIRTNPTLLSQMRHEARHEFETKYTAETNYQLLMQIYETTLASKCGR